MQEYRISREEMLHWCSIPKEELAHHPESKVQHFIMKKERQQAMNVAADMMCEELVRNNAAGRPTKWVLGSGPGRPLPPFHRAREPRAHQPEKLICVPNGRMPGLGRAQIPFGRAQNELRRPYARTVLRPDRPRAECAGKPAHLAHTGGPGRPGQAVRAAGRH